MTQQEVRALLFAEVDSNYAVFSSSLIPNAPKLIGVRLPILRKLSRKLARGEFEPLLVPNEDEYFEETMLRGMIIGEIKCSIEQRFEYIKKFIPSITNWSICDSFCVSLKFAKENKQVVFEFLKPYLSSAKEYEARFGFSMLIYHFINSGYNAEILKAVRNMNCHEYYSDMAAAWCVSMVCVNDKKTVFDFLKNGQTTDRVINLSIRKICESRQIDDVFKKEMKTLRI